MYDERNQMIFTQNIFFKTMFCYYFQIQKINIRYIFNILIINMNKQQLPKQ